MNVIVPYNPRASMPLQPSHVNSAHQCPSQPDRGRSLQPEGIFHAVGLRRWDLLLCRPSGCLPPERGEVFYRRVSCRCQCICRPVMWKAPECGAQVIKASTSSPDQFYSSARHLTIYNRRLWNFYRNLLAIYRMQPNQLGKRYYLPNGGSTIPRRSCYSPPFESWPGRATQGGEAETRRSICRIGGLSCDGDD